ncbi:MAG TPA: S-layer homology domain-containing protein [Candidatus Avidehalobacter gallistercoris]|uniref:S-layer homology domain-containing protein n=1 Tax=Candidatus Avidehalobacter gallistercoris TaxID=2840694 RepID=A0A9D1KYT0_9FIRM|nr:S-layer homology domain-containing protein [Candidatus Avidehalobacter gallistercoris]
MKRKLIAMALSLVMLVGLVIPPGVPVMADDVEGVQTDASTLTTWSEVFGGDTLSTKDIGRIWTDKTVSEESITLQGDVGDSGLTIDKAADADFQVVLSALGSTATIIDQTQIPMDVSLVLDMSPDMEQYVNEMLVAANAALREILVSNPQNRVSVVTYDNTSLTLLPLNHYENYDNGTATTQLLVRTQDGVASRGILTGQPLVSIAFDFDSTCYRNYQVGINEGMYNLSSAADVTAEVKNTSGQTETVLRVPVVISMASGNPERGNELYVGTPQAMEESSYVNPFNIDGQIANLNPQNYIAQSFLSLLTAAYGKQAIEENYTYNGNSKQPYIYTVGLGDLTNDSDKTMAELVLNPQATLTDALQIGIENVLVKDALESFNNSSVQLMRAQAAIRDRHIYQTIYRGSNTELTLDDLKYNDGYFAATDLDTGDAWQNIFDQIINQVNTVNPSFPTTEIEGVAGTGGDSKVLTFTDKLGAYMNVTGMPSIVFGGNKYDAVTSNTIGDTTTYTFPSQQIDANDIYPGGNLNTIQLTVTKGDNDLNMLSWTIPANLLPLRTVTATAAVDPNGTISYAIQEGKNAYPIRLFYSVAKDDTHTWGVADNDYLTANSLNGVTSYYAGEYDSATQGDEQYGTATAVFTPASSNAFYKYTEDTVLYNLVNTAGGTTTYLTEAAAAAAGQTTILPGQNVVNVNDVAYRLQPATGYTPGLAYYYEHVYYQATGIGDAADKLTDYHMLEDGSRISVSNNAMIVDSVLYIKAGTDKLSRVADANFVKSPNVTDTASTYNYPVFANGQVTVRLGNNGLLTEAALTGSLTVTVDATTGDGANQDQEFTYTLNLSNLNGQTALSGAYAIKINNTDSGTKISNGGTFSLKAGDTAVIEGLPVGAQYQLTQTHVDGYTPAFTGDVVAAVGQGGYINYADKSGTVTLDKSVTVTNAYDATTATYLLTYNGNAIEGTVTGVPAQQGGIQGGTTVALSVDKPAHSNVDGKAVAFIGWTETKTDKIYSLEDKQEFAALTVYAASAQYTMPNTNTTLYAVWGYDTNNDGTADVAEDVYTLTYNANGGAFADNATTKTVDVVAQTGYTLLSGAPLPTHAEGTWDKKTVAVVCMGWSETKHENIYSVNDSRPTDIVTSVDITGNTTVYAVWGYDADGNGTADINDGTWTITVETGDNGSAAVDYSFNQPAANSLARTLSNTYSVVAGQNLTVNITPDSGYAVDTITVDNVPYKNTNGAASPSGAGYTSTSFQAVSFNNVAANHTISITFDAVTGDGNIPDKYNRTLTYNANGGEFADGNATITKQHLEEKSYRFTDSAVKVDAPTHDAVDGKDVLFLGWLTENDKEDNKIYGAEDTGVLSKLQYSVTISATGTQLYAAWAYDEDGDGVPDVEQAAKYALTYDTNAMENDTVTGGITDDNDYISGQTVVLADGSSLSYTESGADAKKVVFIGWSANDTDQIYSDSDDDKAAFAKITIVPAVTFDKANITVYAVWGYDADGDGRADVLGNDYVIYPFAGLNGSINPDKATTVTKGGEKAFTLSPASGYAVDLIYIDRTPFCNDGTEDLAGYDKDNKTYTFSDVQADHSIVVTFAEDADSNGIPDKYKTYTVTASVDGSNNGSISPATKVVRAGDDVEFTITANADYALDYITVNDDVVYANNDAENPFESVWTLEDVQADSAVVAYFGEDTDGDGIPDEPTYLTVTAQAGANGTISPSGTVFVKRGENQTFTIAANSGYHISDVTVNGQSVGAVSSYEIENITANAAITASFAVNTGGGATRYIINASAGKGGKISPDGSVSVIRNGERTFTITANEGYEISDVLVDGESVGAVEKYTFEKVRERHTIEAIFALESGVADPDDTNVSDWLNTKDHNAYLNGYADGAFAPGSVMTRAEVAQMFYNLLLDKNVAITANFVDVADNAWYAKPVNTLASLGIIKGVGDNRFDPNRAITRAEFTVIAMGFAELDTGGKNIFTDVDEDDWFYDQVVGSIQYGWINGYEDGSFRPNNTITRAEVTTITNRLLDRAADEDYVDAHAGSLRTFSDVSVSNWAYYNIIEATNGHEYKKSGSAENWTDLAD